MTYKLSKPLEMVHNPSAGLIKKVEESRVVHFRDIYQSSLVSYHSV